MNISILAQGLWNGGIVLRDDGMSDGDDVEQLTLLRFNAPAKRTAGLRATRGSAKRARR